MMLRICGYITNDNGPVASMKVKAFLNSHPEMQIKFESVSDDGKLTQAGLRKFFNYYATHIAGVKDVIKFSEEMKACWKNQEEE